MSWFDTEGKQSGHAVFSQTVYKRNLARHPFVGRMEEKPMREIADKLDQVLTKNGFWKEELDFSDIPRLNSFVEKGFIDRNLLIPSPVRALYFNEPCSLSVALGGCELITIRSTLPGLSVTESRNIASEAEALLDREFDFAYSERYGYMTADQNLLGSAQEFSSLLYLPSLRSCEKEREELRARLFPSGATLTPMMSDGNNSGDLYTVSCIPRLFSDDLSAAKAFGRLIQSVIDEEEAKARILFEEERKNLIDRARRAFGILLYAKTLSEAEFLSFWSDIRFAVAAFGEKSTELMQIDTSRLNLLLVKGLNNAVVSENDCHSLEECDDKRAETVSGLLYNTEASFALA